MRCQACDKNEATTTVICESCQAHYASVREGQYREQELEVGEFQLRITSWTSVPAPASKKQARADKDATKKKGGLFFGKKAPPEPEPEPPPPPDWKNRVHPGPDGDPLPLSPAAAAAAAGAAGAAMALTATEAEAQGFGEGLTNFSYGLDDGADAVVAQTDPVMEIATPELAELELAPEPVAELELAPAPELASVFEVATPEVAAPAEPAALESTVPVAPDATPSPELSSFFESLGGGVVVEPPAPEPVAEEAPPEPEAPAALLSFFDSLGTPPAPASEPAAMAEPAAEAGVPDALAGFFDSLSDSPAAETPVVETPMAPEPAPNFEVPAPVVETPAAAEPAPSASAELGDFFASLGTPPAAPAATPAAAEPAAPAADLSDFFASLGGPAAETPAAPAAADPVPTTSAELGDFFASLAAPEPAAPVAEVPAPVVEAPKPAAPAPSGGIELSEAHFSGPAARPATPAPAAEAPLAGFFESLGQVPEAPAQPHDGSKASPFAIDIEMPGAVKPGASAAAAPNADAMRPPTFGAPFSIDLGALNSPPPPPPKASSQAEDLKKKHSTGELNFVGDDEEAQEATGFGLLDGVTLDLTPGAKQPSGPSTYNAPARGAFHDDDDDSKTIEL